MRMKYMQPNSTTPRSVQVLVKIAERTVNSASVSNWMLSGIQSCVVVGNMRNSNQLRHIVLRHFTEGWINNAGKVLWHKMYFKYIQIIRSLSQANAHMNAGTTRDPDSFHVRNDVDVNYPK